MIIVVALGNVVTTSTRVDIVNSLTITIVIVTFNVNVVINVVNVNVNIIATFNVVNVVNVNVQLCFLFATTCHVVYRALLAMRRMQRCMCERINVSPAATRCNSEPDVRCAARTTIPGPGPEGPKIGVSGTPKKGPKWPLFGGSPGPPISGPRGGPGGVTFSRVFNNSPSRDRFFPRPVSK